MPEIGPAHARTPPPDSPRPRGGVPKTHQTPDTLPERGNVRPARTGPLEGPNSPSEDRDLPYLRQVSRSESRIVRQNRPKVGKPQGPRPRRSPFSSRMRAGQTSPLKGCPPGTGAVRTAQPSHPPLRRPPFGPPAVLFRWWAWWGLGCKKSPPWIAVHHRVPPVCRCVPRGVRGGTQTRSSPRERRRAPRATETGPILPVD